MPLKRIEFWFEIYYSNVSDNLSFEIIVANKAVVKLVVSWMYFGIVIKFENKHINLDISNYCYIN